MRLGAKISFASCLSIALQLSVLDALSLSDYQPIGGFPKACTDAYNTPLSACSPADFDHGRACSTECIKSLDSLTLSIIAACKGTNVQEGNLIGFFFVSQGTAFMCPHVGSASEAAGQPLATSSADAKPSNSPTSSPNTPKKSSTITASETAETLSSTLLTTSSTSTGAASTLESTENSASSIPMDPTSEPTSTPTRSTIPLSLLTAASSTTVPAADSTTSSVMAKVTHGGDGGGGTPFDITSSASRKPKAIPILVIFASLSVLHCLI